MATFHLVRHGEAQYDLAESRRLIGGMRDMVPLTERGRLQAERAAEQLVGRGISSVVASPMTRAMETAQIIAGKLQLPLLVEFDLHEWLPDLNCAYCGREYVLQQSAELERHAGEWPEGERRSWEPLSQVRARVLAVLARYDHLDQVVVVAHGMVIFALTDHQASNGEVLIYHLPEA